MNASQVKLAKPSMVYTKKIKEPRKLWWADDECEVFKLKEVPDHRIEFDMIDYEYKIGRLADTLNTHIRGSLRNHRYDESGISESLIVPNKITAYGDLKYLSFEDRVNNAKQLAKTLISKGK